MLNVAGGLRLDQINQKRVMILVVDPLSALPYAEYFREKGFTVEVATDPSEMYGALSTNGPPGFVLISSQFETPMALMMPDFCVKRFKTPVVLFRETEEKPAPDLKLRTLPAEVLALPDYAGPECILGEIENYETNYKIRRSMGDDIQIVQGKGPKQTAPEPKTGSLGKIRSDQAFGVLREIIRAQKMILQNCKMVTLHSCKIGDNEHRDYFLFALPAEGKNSDLKKILEPINQKIIAAGGSELVPENLAGQIPHEFFKSIMGHSEDVILGLVDTQELAVVRFRDQNGLAEFETEIAKESFLVPMEEWWTRVPLPCPAYMWMEKNDRRLLFVKVGGSLRPEAFTRLNRKGVGQMAIDPQDLDAYGKIRELVLIADKADIAPSGSKT